MIKRVFFDNFLVLFFFFNDVNWFVFNLYVDMIDVFFDNFNVE